MGLASPGSPCPGRSWEGLSLVGHGGLEVVLDGVSLPRGQRGDTWPRRQVKVQRGAEGSRDGAAVNQIQRPGEGCRPVAMKGKIDSGGRCNEQSPAGRRGWASRVTEGALTSRCPRPQSQSHTLTRPGSSGRGTCCIGGKGGGASGPCEGPPAASTCLGEPPGGAGSDRARGGAGTAMGQCEMGAGDAETLVGADVLCRWCITCRWSHQRSVSPEHSTWDNKRIKA